MVHESSWPPSIHLSTWLFNSQLILEGGYVLCDFAKFEDSQKSHEVVLMCTQELLEETNLSGHPWILSFSYSNTWANSVCSTFKLSPESDYYPLSYLTWIIARASQLLPASALGPLVYFPHSSYRILLKPNSDHVFTQTSAMAIALIIRCPLGSHNSLLCLWPTFLQLSPCSLPSSHLDFLAVPQTCQANYALAVSSAGCCPHPIQTALSLFLGISPQMSPYQRDLSWPSL